jgi:O-antigen ligase
LGRVLVVVLVSGLGATLSRAGLGAFAAGVVVLGLLVGPRLLWRRTRRSVVGTAICVLALVPGMPAGHPARPVVALMGLGVGLAIGAGPVGSGAARPRRAMPGLSPWRQRVFGWALAVALLLVAGAGAVGATHSRVWSGRVSASSTDRASLWSVAVKEWQAHPWTGVGPGRAVFVWTTADRGLLYDRYAHDEYLQTAVEEGALGLVGLAALAGAVAVTARRGWRESAYARADGDLDRDVDRDRDRDRDLDHLAALRAGAIAGLVCFALHSGFDFLWHVPVVPLVAAVAVGLAAPLPAAAQRRLHPAPPTTMTQEVPNAS